MLFLMQPKRCLAFWAVCPQGCVMLSFLSTKTCQVLLLRTPLSLFSTQPVFLLGIAVVQILMSSGCKYLEFSCVGRPLLQWSYAEDCNRVISFQEECSPEAEETRETMHEDQLVYCFYMYQRGLYGDNWKRMESNTQGSYQVDSKNVVILTQLIQIHLSCDKNYRQNTPGVQKKTNSSNVYAEPLSSK
ncbi:uncharacterized protein LOC135294584 isoform X4 [Passer domesticus]|uniref:uncharacterized protein LOC135294584 isoform X4 n=1 Tax=Passer domesticus TaxID=48849 RepID=UPI0030FE659F